MSREQFVDTFGGLFQGPRWAVERAYESGRSPTRATCAAAFQEALYTANEDEQRLLIDSYPDLGAESVADGREGEDSLHDQAFLGLTRLDEKSYGELSELTAQYRERFGFPLVTCVRDRDSFDQVVRSGWQRLENSPAQEHAAALVEAAKIAGYRFDDLVADANPIHSARTRFVESQ